MTPGCIVYWPLATYPCPFPDPFPSVGGGAHRPLTTLSPSSPGLAYPYLPTHPSFPSGGRAHGAPRTVPVSLRCVGSTRRRATALSIGQGRPSGHPIPAVGEPSPPAALGGEGGGGRFKGGGGSLLLRLSATPYIVGLKVP